MTLGEVAKVLGMGFDSTRHKRWGVAAQVLARFEEEMVVVAEGLGHLDCKLIAAEDELHPDKLTQVSELNFKLLEHATLSHLWVLGAYELVRSIHKRKSAVPGCEQELESLKGGFTRIRVPLAKFEAAKKHADDYTFPIPKWHPNGLGWAVGPNAGVTRRSLGDALLDVLESLSAKHPGGAEHSGFPSIPVLKKGG